MHFRVGNVHVSINGKQDIIVKISVRDLFVGTAEENNDKFCSQWLVIALFDFLM
jgi:hypothetical protein